MRTVIGVRSGNSTPPSNSTKSLLPTIWFASTCQFAGVLSDENRALLRLIRDRQPRTLQKLVSASGRALSNLSRTLQNLERHGLVRMHRSPNTRAVRPEALATEFLVILD